MKRYNTKSKNRVAILIFVAVVAFSLISPVFAAASATAYEEYSIRPYRLISDEEYYPEEYIGYVYPIRPGTAEWAALPDHKAMIEACKIPDNILSSMSTEALLQSILAYPLIGDIFAYDDWNIGMSVITEHFNGLSAYEQRIDGAYAIVEEYSELATAYSNSEAQKIALNSDALLENKKTFKEYEANRNVLYSMVMGVILANNTHIDQLSAKNYQSLCESAKIISITNDSLTMEKSDLIEPAADTNLEATASWSYWYQLDYCPCAVNSTTIAGPNNTTISVQENGCCERWVCTDGQIRIYENRVYSDIPSAYKTTINEQMYNVYGINPIAQPTVKYNCHSYAWYLQSTSNPYWINDVSPYLNCGRYSVISQMNTVVGNRVVYYKSHNKTYTTPTHSAVITAYTNVSSTQRNFTLKSKWGMAGLYSHSLTNCPYYFGETESEQVGFVYDYRFYG